MRQINQQMFSKTLTLASRNFKKVKVEWRGSTSGQPSLQDGQPATGDPQIHRNVYWAIAAIFLTRSISLSWQQKFPWIFTFHFSFLPAKICKVESGLSTTYLAVVVVVESEWMTKEVLIRIFSSSFFSQASRISWSCVLTENWGGRKVPRTLVWTVIKTPSVLCLLWKKKIKGKKENRKNLEKTRTT